MKDLIKMPLGELLPEFGAGNHKPGSGSGTAVQGMLSAQFIRTVIDLSTNDEHRKYYTDWQEDFKKIDSDIVNSIYPRLERLLQEDSVEFDKAIRLREARDEAKKRGNVAESVLLADQALQALKPATEIPIEIAQLCVKLANHAVFIFDHGFQAARGDSSVALHGAVSAVAGCISIIDLNLTSFGNDNWVDEIGSKLKPIRRQCEALSLEAADRLAILKSEADQKRAMAMAFQKLLYGFQAKKNLRYNEIEIFARDLQNLIWTHRHVIWKKNTPNTPIAMLNADKVIKELLGFGLDKKEALGQYELHGKMVEVAGMMNRDEKVVSISKKFSPEVRNFTLAHELGHCLMHKQVVLHRDRPLDGSSTLSRDAVELQADKFAAFFLMPAKEVIRKFKDRFLTEKLILNENTLFGLNLGTRVSAFKQEYDKEALSKLIAATGQYQGQVFDSMSKVFNVSVEAMAYRLIELDLIAY